MFYYKSLGDDVVAPSKAHREDAGFDLFAPHDIVIHGDSLVKVNLELAVEVGPGTVGLILGRSSLASLGIDILGGVVDAGYSGEVSVVLCNNSSWGPVTIKKGKAIAQIVPLVLAPRADKELQEYDFAGGERGEGGFGSSGR